MADIHQLENKMRLLKLNGMLDTLELRLTQAQKDGLGFTQFLEISPYDFLFTYSLVAQKSVLCNSTGRN